MKILIVSVGGSCAPIVKSIQENRPNRVVFVCSEDDPITSNKGSYNSITGQGKVCGADWRNPDKPNVVAQTNLKEEEYSIEKIERFDDHNFCYKRCVSIIRAIKEEYTEAEIIVDYTGGTKSMTVGLVMAAADIGGIIVSIVKGDRMNLVKVDDGTERITLSRTNYAFLEKQKQNVLKLMNRYDFAIARTTLNDMFRNLVDIPKEFEDELRYLFTVSKAFEDWDKFKHKEALNKLKSFRKKYFRHVIFLEHIIFSINFIERNNDLEENGEDIEFPKNCTGYEAVEDLLLNAERRAYSERFDDAVARIYRATELFVQVYLLKTYNLKTGDIDLSKLPKPLRDEYSKKANDKGKVAIGLMESYRLLLKLEDKTIGPLFQENEKRLLSSLETRNKSILAHGFTPVTNEDFKKVKMEMVENFLMPCLNKVDSVKNMNMQFPQEDF